jgi:acetyltransferase-like isoleucine patch superfamily enzyme
MQLSGITIGEHSVLGALAVVTKGVPLFTLVWEVPAALMKTIDRPRKVHAMFGSIVEIDFQPFKLA